MQAAPKAIGQVPYRPRYPRNKSLHPSQPLPRPYSLARARGSFFSFLVVAAVTLTPLALLQLSLQAYLTQSSYRAVRLKAQIEEEKSVQEKLRVNVTEMSSPERVQKVAIEKLSMTYPAEINFISLPEEQTSPTSFARLPKEEVGR